MVNDKKFPCQDSQLTITPIVYSWGTTMVLDLSLTSGQMAFVTSQVNLTVFAKKYSNKFLSHFTLIDELVTILLDYLFHQKLVLSLLH